MNSDKKLTELFEIAEEIENTQVMKPKQVEVILSGEETSHEKLDTDFEIVRKNYMNLILKGSETLNDLLELAKETEHPRTYEVLSGLISTLSTLNKDLIEIHTAKSKIENVQHVNKTQITQQNVFVGSTSDLQKMLKKATEEPE
jgi:hypothetical protein